MGRKYRCATRICCRGFFPGTSRREQLRFASWSAGRKMALCRSWIDSVACVTTDYTLFHSHLDSFLLFGERSRFLWKDRYDLILNRNPEDRVTCTNFSEWPSMVEKLHYWSNIRHIGFRIKFFSNTDFLKINIGRSI